MENANFFNALYNYYELNSAKLPEFGFSNFVPIEHVVTIDNDGQYITYRQNRSKNENGHEVPGTMNNVPFDIRAGRNINAHTLYGKFGYFFPAQDCSDNDWNKKHEAFMDEVKYAKENDEDKSDFEAIEKFYSSGEWKKFFDEIVEIANQKKQKDFDSATSDKSRKEIEKKSVYDYITGDFTFQILDKDETIIEDPAHKEAYLKCFERQMEDKYKHSYHGIDSITGKYCKLIDTFFSKSMQASLISFNNDASCSHGYEQMGNCPMGVETAFKIVSAYDYLLNDNKHHIKIGSNGADSLMLFWSTTNSTEMSQEEVEDDFLAELNAFINPFVKQNDGEASEEDKGINEDIHDENDSSEKVHSVFDGNMKSMDTRNSTFYVATISKPSRGSIFLSSFKNGKIGEIYDNIDRYQKDFMAGKNYFVNPYMAVQSAYRRSKDGTPIKGEKDSKNHINMRKELLLTAIFGGEYKTPLMNKIIERIYKEMSVEFNCGNGKVNHTGRMSCLVAYASQFNLLDKFKYERNFDNLPYQTGAFYGVVEAIRQKYNLVSDKVAKNNEARKIDTAEFRKGLLNQTNDFIVSKLKRDSIVLAGYLKDKGANLVGDYSKKRKWNIEKKCYRWVVNHDEKWGQLDWAIYHMNRLADQKKGVWDTNDKSLFIIGFYRMLKLLIGEKPENAEANA